MLTYPNYFVSKIEYTSSAYFFPLSPILFCRKCAPPLIVYSTLRQWKFTKYAHTYFSEHIIMDLISLHLSRYTKLDDSYTSRLNLNWNISMFSKKSQWLIIYWKKKFGITTTLLTWYFIENIDDIWKCDP